MERRRFLAAVGSLGATGLAGCTSESIETIVDDGGDGGGDGGGGLGGGGGQADVRIDDYELVLEEEDTYRVPYVEAAVTNHGDGPTGEVDLTADWFDENDDYLGDSGVEILTLDPGETWIPRVTATGADDELVDSCDLSLEVDDDVPQQPGDFEVIESELKTEDDDVVVVGRAENDTGADVDYIEAFAKLYDGDGRVLASEWTNESDVPAGTVWRFDLDFYFFERGDLVEDYEVGVDADPF